MQVAVVVHQLQANGSAEESLPKKEKKECREEGRGIGFPEALLEFFKNISDLFSSLSTITIAVPIDPRPERLTELHSLPPSHFGGSSNAVFDS